MEPRPVDRSAMGSAKVKPHPSKRSLDGAPSRFLVEGRACLGRVMSWEIYPTWKPIRDRIQQQQESPMQAWLGWGIFKSETLPVIWFTAGGMVVPRSEEPMGR